MDRMVHSDSTWLKVHMLEVREEHGKQSEEENQKRTNVICAKKIKFQGKGMCQMEGT